MDLSSTIDKPRLKQAKRGAAALATPVSKGVRKALDTGSAERAALVDVNKPLTAQQMAFVQAWARGESIHSASQRAGYSSGDGFCYRMARMPNVLRVYEREKALYEAASQMTRQRVMDGILEGIEMAKLMAEPATMITGWRDIGKMCGYFEPVKHTLDINIKGDVTVRQLNGMSDAELLKLLSADAPLQLPDLTHPHQPEDEDA